MGSYATVHLIVVFLAVYAKGILIVSLNRGFRGSQT